MSQRFNKWLLNRKIVKRPFSDDICFDADYFMQNNANENVEENTNNNNEKIYKYQLLTPPKDNKFLPDDAVRSIDKYLDEMNEFLPKKSRPISSEEKPFVDNIIENGQGDFEPVWSSTEIQNPAELLLPDEEKLFVKEIKPSLPISFVSSDYSEKFQYKNNLMTIFGDYLYVVDGLFLLVYSIKDLSCGNTEHVVRYFINMETQTAKDVYGNINFIKIVSMFNMPMLALCADSGSIFLSNIGQLEGLIKRHKDDENADSSDLFMDFDLNVHSSCWSIDSFDESGVCILAIGSNIPGVTIYVFRLEDLTNGPLAPDNRFLKKTIQTRHNIPSVNFLPKIDDDGGVTLSFVSIFGNVTTVKLFVDFNAPLTSFDIKFQDTQFFGVAAWTVTPLSRKDFKKVDEFEFLNLNYHSADKKSILQSVVMDSHILECQPPKLYSSGSFGIGSLTTQIIVPHARLSWRTSRSLSRMYAIKLSFTSFDKEGKISSAFLNIPNYQIGSHSLYDLPKYSPERIKKLHSEDVSTHYYYYKSIYGYAIPNENDKLEYNSWFFSQKFDIANNSRNDINEQNATLSKPYEFLKPSIVSNKLRKNLNFKHMPTIKKFGRELQGQFWAFSAVRDDKSEETVVQWKDIYNPNGNTYEENGIEFREDDEDFTSTLESNNSENFPERMDTDGGFSEEGFSEEGFGENENRETDQDEEDNDDNYHTEYTNDEQLNINNFVYPHSDLRNYYLEYTMGMGSLHQAYLSKLENKRTRYFHQKLWSVHNHAMKVKKLLENIDSQNESSALSYKLKACDDDFLLVTTITSIILLKASPLIMTSIMYDDIFPVLDSSLCYDNVHDLNRISFVCHIKELNCIVAASQMGYISLLRLTNYRGIYSFRQEYILGWESQDPFNKKPDYVCTHNLIFHEDPPMECSTCDVRTPYLNIRGLDYSFFPGNKTTGTSDHAILYVFARNLHKFKITRGSDMFK